MACKVGVSDGALNADAEVFEIKVPGLPEIEEIDEPQIGILRPEF